jgi:integrase
MDGMPRPRLPHLITERSRHGALVWYVRKGHGKRIRLRAEYGAPEFWSEYRAALEGAPQASATGKAAPQSFAWAIDHYRASNAWKAFSEATRNQRDPIYTALEKTIGREPLARITEATIQNSMDARRERPHSANNFLKAMRGFFKWAASEGKLVAADPTRGSTLLKGPNAKLGIHTWTEEEVERFEARWPIGTRARLAFDLLLYTGLRRGDVVKVGRQHVRNGVITIRTEKGRNSDKDNAVFIRILPPLARSIEATKTGDLSYLVTREQTPFVKGSFGNWFKACCRAAGCPGSAHGLRKAGASRAAMNGASERQLMAMYGWTDADMARHYTEAANRQRLSVEGSKLLLRGAENPAPSTRQSRTSRKPLG